MRKDFLFGSIEKIKQNNKKGEFYLTDIIEIGSGEVKNIGVLIGSNHNEVMGINPRKDLTRVENMIQNRSCDKS